MARNDGCCRTLVAGKRYKLTVYLGATDTGARRYWNQVFRGTEKQARKRLAQLVTDLDRGIMPVRVVPEPEPVVAPVLLGETLDRWLKHKSTNRKARPRTIANYQWLLDTYVKPVLGSKPIAELSESDIQDCYSKLLERGISGKTCRNLHKVLEPALTRAVGWSEIPKNPALHVELPVWERKEAKYLTREQTLAFLNEAKSTRWYAGFLLAVESGARPNEWLALRWSDVYFDNHSISIKRSLYWPKGGSYVYTKPKTQRSNRTITISAQAIEALRQHKRTQLEQRLAKGSKYQDEGLVFATRLGGPVVWRNLARRYFKPLLTTAGVPPEGFSLYSLRHTAASLLIAAGENIRVIAERLGTSVAMIDVTYSHVSRALQQTATDRLARMLHCT